MTTASCACRASLCPASPCQAPLHLAMAAMRSVLCHADPICAQLSLDCLAKPCAAIRAETSCAQPFGDCLAILAVPRAALTAVPGCACPNHARPRLPRDAPRCLPCRALTWPAAPCLAALRLTIPGQSRSSRDCRALRSHANPGQALEHHSMTAEPPKPRHAVPVHDSPAKPRLALLSEPGLDRRAGPGRASPWEATPSLDCLPKESSTLEAPLWRGQ
jgi:hypothetical protein